MQPCPYCAEPIQPAAQVCPHCRTNLRKKTPGLNLLLFLALVVALAVGTIVVAIWLSLQVVGS